jgi:hypothetical protein
MQNILVFLIIFHPFLIILYKICIFIYILY